VCPKVDQRAGLLSLPHLGNFRRTATFTNICLYLVSIHQRATPLLNSAALLARLLLIYRSRRDERLIWPSWLTHSGRLTHKVVTRQPWIRRRSRKVRRLQTDVLTTEPRRQSGKFRQQVVQAVGFDQHALEKLSLQQIAPFMQSRIAMRSTELQIVRGIKNNSKDTLLDYFNTVTMFNG